MELKIEYIDINKLTPYEKNTRQHHNFDIEHIMKSIQKYGFNDAIGIWGKNNIIVEGHGRYMAAPKLGLTELPCVRLDHLTDEERREYAIIHNKSAELSMWDLQNLEEEIKELDMSDWDDIYWGFEDQTENETEDESTEKGVSKKLLKCPVCGHINEEKAFKNYEDSD